MENGDVSVTILKNDENNEINVAIVRGERGLAGYSAYQIAVRNGYIGTEQEWLTSLNGEDGINGKDGKDGKDGYTPQKGIDYFTSSEIEGIEQECTYDDTNLSNRVESLETTIGTLNDSLEVVLNGGE